MEGYKEFQEKRLNDYKDALWDYMLDLETKRKEYNQRKAKKGMATLYISRAAIAARLNRSVRTIENWENGKNLPDDPNVYDRLLWICDKIDKDLIK